ncbi:hypothetical protein COB21_04670 [Candidatus Aerophobetes bacterium]|uniref:Aminotransferase class V domain-containing protein n=1 Tax=Aerophobetes bacterium TaxID=2030807 RepID=A0A2A4X134_UNCAE|nr:MAG: hypothetical protein COB21_04670 [Candidatus Aerophobetes bacterium]
MIYLDQLTYKRDLLNSFKEDHANGRSLKFAWQEIKSFFSINDEDATFVFTSSGAEAIAQVYWSVYNHEILPSGLNHMITSNLEEAPILMGLERYNKLGALVDVADSMGRACLTREALEPYFTPYTKFVSISAVSVQTGARHDLESISQLCKEKGVLLHIDMSDLVGYKPIDFHKLQADYITVDGARFGAVEGTGVLLAKKERKIEPLILDYMGQKGYRGGALDEKKIIDFSLALSVMLEKAEKYLIHLPLLQKFFEESCVKEVPGCSLPFKGINRVAHVSAIQIEGAFNELLIFYLRERGVHVHLGGGMLQQTGGLFEKVGVEPFKTSEILSFAWSIDMDRQTIHQAVQVIKEEVKRVLAVKSGEGSTW